MMLLNCSVFHICIQCRWFRFSFGYLNDYTRFACLFDVFDFVIVDLWSCSFVVFFRKSGSNSMFSCQPWLVIDKNEMFWVVEISVANISSHLGRNLQHFKKCFKYSIFFRIKLLLHYVCANCAVRDKTTINNLW